MDSTSLRIGSKDQAEGTVDIALFPIPGLVAFPGARVPLHVFEPRYRALIRDCIDGHRPVGLCHTRKVISTPRRKQDLQEALRSNQATYQPHEVLSAGDCEIRKVTEDGRLHAVVAIRSRYRILEEIQTLPYRIVRSLPYVDLDDETPEEQADAGRIQREITGMMWKLLEQTDPGLSARVDWRHWLNLPPAEFSFRLFDHLQFDPDLMQRLLESQRAVQRLELIRRILQQAKAPQPTK